ncbi:hypothetical protein TZ53_23780 (plasmid) [Sphingobium sp. YBL2]|nr:hypothetical protein TZ53_23780 [Sphingobium sp. YBL2]
MMKALSHAERGVLSDNHRHGGFTLYHSRQLRHERAAAGEEDPIYVYVVAEFRRRFVENVAYDGNDLGSVLFYHAPDFSRGNMQRLRRHRHEASSSDLDQPIAGRGLGMKSGIILFDAFGALTADQNLVSKMQVISDRLVEGRATRAH